MSGTSWVSQASPCHCICKKKSSDLKTSFFVPVASVSRQGTFSANWYSYVHALVASGAVTCQLMGLFYLSRTSPMSACVLPN